MLDKGKNMNKGKKILKKAVKIALAVAAGVMGLALMIAFIGLTELMGDYTAKHPAALLVPAAMLVWILLMDMTREE